MQKDIMAKRELEKKLVSQMISLYCKKKHGVSGGLCKECEELEAYARMRSDKCPFMETKTFCSNCRVHCYQPVMREKISVGVGLGAVGAVLPLLPAFPFLMLAAFCLPEALKNGITGLFIPNCTKIIWKLCKGSGDDVENQNQNHDYGYNLNVHRLCYDGSSAGRKNYTWVCVVIPYSLFYFWCKELQNLLMASKLSSLKSCSTRHASSNAVSFFTPILINQSERMV